MTEHTEQEVLDLQNSLKHSAAMRDFRGTMHLKVEIGDTVLNKFASFIDEEEYDIKFSHMSRTLKKMHEVKHLVGFYPEED